MKGPPFFVSEAATLAGLPYRTLDGWIRSGMIHPLPAHKDRERRLLTERETFLAFAAANLRARGVPTQGLRRVIPSRRQMMEQIDAVRAEGSRIVDGGAFYATRRGLIEWSWTEIEKKFREARAEMREEERSMR